MKSLGSGDLAKAREQYEKALALVPSYPDGHMGLGHSSRPISRRPRPRRPRPEVRPSPDGRVLEDTSGTVDQRYRAITVTVCPTLSSIARS
jgi:hypothetical protein